VGESGHGRSTVRKLHLVLPRQTGLGRGAVDGGIQHVPQADDIMLAHTAPLLRRGRSDGNTGLDLWAYANRPCAHRGERPVPVPCGRGQRSPEPTRARIRPAGRRRCRVRSHGAGPIRRTPAGGCDGAGRRWRVPGSGGDGRGQWAGQPTLLSHGLEGYDTPLSDAAPCLAGIPTDGTIRPAQALTYRLTGCTMVLGRGEGYSTVRGVRYA
jgi:hypothetical protein